MKIVTTAIVALFAVAAMAADHAATAPAAGTAPAAPAPTAAATAPATTPAATTATKEVKAAKKDAKGTATAKTEDACKGMTGEAHKACMAKATTNK